ncbi:MAG TPA: VTT domain-containing protein [Spirochaetia bacterium]|nr:VTT domain-containing protein [Spirochaetia bacterium]
MNQQRRVAALVVFPLLIVALVVPVLVWHSELWRIFGSVRRIRDWIEGWGAVAPLVFVGVQVVQVVVFAIPGEVVQIAGGYLFGGGVGILLSLGGILLGSTAAFYLSRLLGRPFVAAVVPAAQLERVEKLLESPSSRIVFFLLFLIPGVPKDILCYIAGLTPMGFFFFLGVSIVGRLPGIVGSSMIGGAARSSRWVALGVLSVAAIVLFIAGLILRPRLQALIERVAGHHGAEAPAEAPKGNAAATGSSPRRRTARRTPRPSSRGRQ